jgi:hypothetical protein
MHRRRFLRAVFRYPAGRLRDLAGTLVTESPGGAPGVPPFAVSLPPASVGAFPRRTCPPAVSRPPAARSFSPGPGSRARPSCLGHSPTLRSLICRAPPAACVRRGSWAFFSRASRATPSGSSLLETGVAVTALGFGSSLRSSGVGRRDTPVAPLRRYPHRLPGRPPLWAASGPGPLVGFVARVVCDGRVRRSATYRHSDRVSVRRLSFGALCARPGLARRPFSRRPFSGQGGERLADPAPRRIADRVRVTRVSNASGFAGAPDRLPV